MAVDTRKEDKLRFQYTNGSGTTRVVNHWALLISESAIWCHLPSKKKKKQVMRRTPAGRWWRKQSDWVSGVVGVVGAPTKGGVGEEGEHSAVSWQGSVSRTPGGSWLVALSVTNAVITKLITGCDLVDGLLHTLNSSASN